MTLPADYRDEIRMAVNQAVQELLLERSFRAHFTERMASKPTFMSRLIASIRRFFNFGKMWKHEVEAVETIAAVTMKFLHDNNPLLFETSPEINEIEYAEKLKQIADVVNEYAEEQFDLLQEQFEKGTLKL